MSKSNVHGVRRADADEGAVERHGAHPPAGFAGIARRAAPDGHAAVADSVEMDRHVSPVRFSLPACGFSASGPPPGCLERSASVGSTASPIPILSMATRPRPAEAGSVSRSARCRGLVDIQIVSGACVAVLLDHRSV